MDTKDINDIELTELMQNVHRIARIGVFQFSVKENRVYWNDIMKEINEVQPNFKPTRDNIFSFFAHEKTKQEVEKIHIKAVKEGTSFSYDHEIITAKGNSKHIWTFGQPVIQDGELIQIFGSAIDITERKKSELELVKKNKLLSFAEEMTNIGYWDWDTVNNEEIWSDNLYKIVNRKKGGKLTYETYLEYVHPEDMDYVLEQMASAFENKVFPNFSHRIIVNTSDIKIIHLMGEVICNTDGDVIKMLGTCQDITDIKKREQIILQKNQQLNFAEKMAKIGNWEFNLINDTVTWSDNLYEIYGHDKSEPINYETYLNYVYKEDKSFVTRSLESTLEKKEFQNATYRIQLKNGSLKTIKSLGKVVLNNNGEIIGMQGTCQDITETKNRELELLEKQQQLSLAEEIAQIGYWEWNPHTGHFIWSDNLYRIFDFEIGIEMSLELLLTRVPPEDQKKLERITNKLIETKKFKKFSYRIISPQGHTKTLEVLGQIILDQQGKIIKFIGVTQDITDFITKEKKILETNERLKESKLELIGRNKQLAEFNHITSHNLRSPVSNLNALLGLYKDTTAEAKKTELFDKFEIVINHLTLTLNSLIESLKINNRLNQSTTELNFIDVFNKTQDVLAAEILNSQAIINYDFDKAPTITYNNIYLESIFLNLVSNSLKYKSPNRIPKISIKTAIKNGITILSVKDNGLGIDLDRHGHKLFGLNKVFHRHPDAQGIGLFLTKAQVESMGGTISVESKLDIGTTFLVTLK